MGRVWGMEGREAYKRFIFGGVFRQRLRTGLAGGDRGRRVVEGKYGTVLEVGSTYSSSIPLLPSVYFCREIFQQNVLSSLKRKSKQKQKAGKLN